MGISEELARLEELHGSGALSDEEFRDAKARVLAEQGAVPAPPPPPLQSPYGQPPAAESGNSAKVLIGCLIALVAIPVIAILCIIAITFLGRSASSKFSSVGSTGVHCPAGQTVC